MKLAGFISGKIVKFKNSLFVLIIKTLLFVNRKLFFKKNNGGKIKFIVYVPQFNENEGGNILLHRLCDLLNGQGEQAFIWLWPHQRGEDEVFREFNTPVAKISDLGENTIVIYPEIISGNPLGASNVVRWILYRPGDLTGKKPHYGRNDLFFYLHKEFIGPDLNIPPENRLVLRYLFRDIYKQVNFGERRGSCYILRKGSGRRIVHDMEDSVLIDGLSHREIAEIFNRVEYCVSYDLYTAYSKYAVLCGCKSVVVPREGLPREKWFDDERLGYGLAYGFEDLGYAENTRDDLISFLDEQERKFEKNVADFAKKCKSRFNLV